MIQFVLPQDTFLRTIYFTNPNFAYLNFNESTSKSTSQCFMVNLYAKYKICNGTFMIFSPLQVIAVIRFECLDRVKTERASYITMLDYFMEKHRYGVFQTGFGGGVKDMYLVPLSYDDPVPLPIQPFSGPGKAKACLFVFCTCTCRGNKGFVAT